jgi:hypothetical protein
MLTEMGFPAERAKKALWLHRCVGGVEVATTVSADCRC